MTVKITSLNLKMQKTILMGTKINQKNKGY